MNKIIVTQQMIRNATVIDMWEFLVKHNLCKSNGEARRAIEANSLKMRINDDWIIPEMFARQEGQTPRFTTVGTVENQIFRLGKRKFFKITIDE